MQIYIKLLLTVSLAVCFSNDLSQAISKQFPTQIQSSINNNGDIPSDLLDLFYLKLFTDSFYNNNKEYNYDYKLILTQTNLKNPDIIDIRWTELVDGRDYSSSVSWQSNFSGQLSYLLNSNWNVYKIIDDAIADSISQKIYILKRITKK